MAYEMKIRGAESEVKLRSPWAVALSLALFPGFILIGIPPLVSYWRGTRRVQGAARAAHREPVNGWLALVPFLVLSIGFYAYLRVSPSHIEEQEAEPLSGTPVTPGEEGSPTPAA
ncbi:MAG TPA: hypothetical protein VGC32_07580 [Solirubrobacterales bacterium]